MNFNNAHEALKQKEVTIHPKKKARSTHPINFASIHATVLLAQLL